MLQKIGFKTCLLGLLIGFFMGQSLAQDIHFSHIHASPLHLNPSLTGLFNGDFRAIGNVRQQWKSLGVDYKTVGVSADGNLLQLSKYDFLGVGIQMLSDQAGSLNFGTSQAHASISLIKSLDRFGDQFISFGLRGSLVNQKVDLSQAKVFEQDPIFPNFANFSQVYADVSGGLSWFYNGGNNQIAYLGAAFFHLNQPKVSFSNLPVAPVSIGDRLYTRWVIHGGYEGDSKAQTRFMPSFIYMKQGPHQEITLGTFVRYKRTLSPGARDLAPAFYWGTWVRWYGEFDGTVGIDALIMSLRVDKGKMAYTLSYDMNISSLSRASKLRGGPEISVIYILKNPHRKKPRTKMKCPTF